jgi:hypothetical protein
MIEENPDFYSLPENLRQKKRKIVYHVQAIFLSFPNSKEIINADFPNIRREIDTLFFSCLCGFHES